MENDESHTVICQDVFNEVHTKSCKPVPVGDKECINDSLLCKVEKSSESSTLHVQSRTYVSEDLRTSLKVPPAISGEGLELAVKVTISLLTMPRYPSIDSTPFLIRMLKDLSVEYAKESVYFGE